MPSIVLCVGDMIVSKMDTAPPLKEFRVSLALPDDCLALYPMWCLGNNALPISTEQNRPAVCLLYIQLYLLLQFSSDADHLELASDSTGLRAWSPKRLCLFVTSDASCKFWVP